MASTTPSRPRVKPTGVLNYQNPDVFKSFIIKFVTSLVRGERAAFRYWCLGLIPQGKLDISLDDYGDIFNLIEFLQNDNKLSVTDLSILKGFLKAIDRIDLLERLNHVELRTAIGIILEYLSLNGQRGSCFAHDLYADINIDFLVATKETNQELISQAVELLKQFDYKSIIMVVLDDVNQESQQSSQSFWSTLTALLLIVGEVYSSFTSDSAVNINKLLSEEMLKNGGLVSTCFC